MSTRLLAFCLLLLSAKLAAAPLQIVTQVLPETRGNPFSYNSLPAGIINHAVFEGLIRIGPGAEIEPQLAISWQQVTPTTWIFTLRPDVVFSNGEPFTADAVLSATKYLMGEPLHADSLASRTMREKVAGVSVRDELTVVFETKVIDPILPIHLTVLRIPEPNQWAKGIDTFSVEPIGTGPYKVAAWGQREVNLLRNDAAWRPGRIDAIDAIDVNAVSDQTARVTALLSGSADIAVDVSADTFALNDVQQFRLQPRTSTMVQFIQFVAVGESPLKDVRVRQALNYAVNKERLITIFLRGEAKPATQFTHEDAIGYNNKLAAYAYDPDRAKRLLKDAGWENGLEVPTVFVGGSGSDIAVYQQIASDLAAVGVHMELRSMTLPIWMGHLFVGDWPSRAFLTGVQGYNPVGAFTTRSCDWLNPHYCDEDLMPLLSAARSAETRPHLIENIKSLMAYERDNPPGIMLWRRTSFDGLNSKVADYDADRDYLRFDLLSYAQ